MDLQHVKNKPKVSVCIPIYNGADYIEGALNSVLQQKYPDFEIIIVDNCSTDQTVTLAAELSLQSPKIHLYQNEQNIGLAGNLNKCLQLARGEYIKYLCADDLLLPDCLALMVAKLEAHSNVSLVCGGRVSINKQGQPFDLRRYSLKDEIIPGHQAITRCLFGGNFIGEPTAVMFRKSDVPSGFRDDLPQLMDMELWFNLLEHGALLNLKTPVCSIRFHKEQMTQENIKSGKLIEDNILVFNEFSRKSYLKVSPFLTVQHKFRMTYRIWISRKYIEHREIKDLLTTYGLKSLFPFMPIIFFVTAAKKIIAMRKYDLLGSSKY